MGERQEPDISPVALWLEHLFDSDMDQYLYVVGLGPDFKSEMFSFKDECDCEHNRCLETDVPMWDSPFWGRPSDPLACEDCWMQFFVVAIHYDVEQCPWRRNQEGEAAPLPNGWTDLGFVDEIVVEPDTVSTVLITVFEAGGWRQVEVPRIF